MLFITSILYVLLCSFVSANYGPDTKTTTSSIKTVTSKTTSKVTSSVKTTSSVTSKTTKTTLTSTKKTTSSTTKKSKTTSSVSSPNSKSSSKFISISSSLGGTGSTGFGSTSRPAPSTRPASTGTFIGSVPSGPSTTSVSGCPLITLTTTTTYSTTTRYGSTVTITTTPTVTSVDRRSTTRGYTAFFSTTITATTPLSTRTKIVTGSAQKTVTAPTSPGFTPVRCEATYYNPTVTRIVTDFPDASMSTVFAGTPTTVTRISYVAFFMFTTTLPGTSTFYPTDFTTVTSTRSSATTTVYAACATNNVVTEYPGGTNIKFVDALFDVSSPQYIDAADAFDCCQICQATSNCAGNLYFADPGPGPAYCALYILNADTCNPRQIAAKADDGPGDQMDPIVFISNSGCGQIGFQGVVGPDS